MPAPTHAFRPPPLIGFPSALSWHCKSWRKERASAMLAISAQDYKTINQRLPNWWNPFHCENREVPVWWDIWSISCKILLEAAYQHFCFPSSLVSHARSSAYITIFTTPRELWSVICKSRYNVAHLHGPLMYAEQTYMVFFVPLINCNGATAGYPLESAATRISCYFAADLRQNIQPQISCKSCSRF